MKTEESAEAINLLLSHCRTKTYEPKDVVIKPGFKGDILYYLIKGSCSVALQNKNGDNAIIAYINPGDFIGEMGIFVGEMPRQVTVTARETCEIAQIGYERLHGLLKAKLSNEQVIGILTLLGKQMARRLLSTDRKVSNLISLDVEGRIGQLLIELSRSPAAITHPEGVLIHITRQEIARSVGCSRELAGKVLTEFHTQELIHAHGKSLVIYGERGNTPQGFRPKLPDIG